METLFIPTENDLKKWVKEAVKEFITEHQQLFAPTDVNSDCLISRKDIAKFLQVSLPTLTDWIKRGLPAHPQRGRVYFDKQEVLTYIKEKKLRQLKIGSKLHHLKQQFG